MSGGELYFHPGQIRVPVAGDISLFEIRRIEWNNGDLSRALKA